VSNEQKMTILAVVFFIILAVVYLTYFSIACAV